MLICEVLLHLLMESNYFNAVIRVDLNHRKLLSTKLRSGFVNFEVAVHTTVFLGGMFFFTQSSMCAEGFALYAISSDY